jgi:hypothetical protein
MKYLLPLIITILAPFYAKAEVLIPKSCRVSNTKTGVCAWASLETAARYLRITQLYGITKARDKQANQIIKVYQQGKWIKRKRNDGGGTVDNISSELKKRKTRFYIYRKTSFKTLYHGTKKGKSGVVVAIIYNYTIKPLKDAEGNKIYKHIAKGASAHAVLLTHIDSKIIKFIDPNNVADTWVMSRKEFDKLWYGIAVILKPNIPKRKR